MNIFKKVTIKTLQKNRTRTIVTIIGILLSVAMFTAVTASASSFYHFLIASTMARDGSWHGRVYGVDSTKKDEIKSAQNLSTYTFIENIGYAQLTDNINDSKPYLHVGGLDEQAGNLLSIQLREGRLPQNSKEIVIPAHLASNGGIHYQVGDTIVLNIGERNASDKELYPEPLTQYVEYLDFVSENGQNTKDGDIITETFVPGITRSYQVVGIIERPSFELFSSPGYTALTISDAEDANSYDAFLQFNNPKDAIPWIENNFKDYATDMNYSLLRLYVASYESSYSTVIYGMSAVLIFIILFGSISLIYNAFSISVSERSKQFGLLSSLGATKKQLIHSVLFEAFSLCVIGIPLGVLAGIGGIGITFHFLGGMVSNVLYGTASIPLRLHVTIPALVIAIALGLFTVLISAWLPAQKAMKLSPIDAIRQTREINVHPRNVKTSPLTYRIFRLPGLLAAKNFKRNRSKYRATVLSLFVSVVLFVSASSYCSYMTSAAGNVISGSTFDLMYQYGSQEPEVRPTELLNLLAAVPSVTNSAYAYQQYNRIQADPDAITLDYLEFISGAADSTISDSKNTLKNIDSSFYFIDDLSYQAYLEECGLPVADYLNPDKPLAVVLDFVRAYEGDTGKYQTFQILDSLTSKLELINVIAPEGYFNSGSQESEDGTVTYEFMRKDTDEPITLPEASCTTKVGVDIGCRVETPPFFLGESYSNGLCLLYPESAMPALLGANLKDATSDLRYFFTASDHRDAYQKMATVLTNQGLSIDMLYDFAETMETDRTLILIINVFAYGFTILISLIAAANVFNTISTNIILRKREFAMLKSIGLTPKGFWQMMHYECLLYGFKGLLYGLPASIVVTWFIYRSVSAGWSTTFFIPWHSLLIAIGSVFLVVFATMLYTVSKMRNDNLMDVLKNENL